MLVTEEFGPFVYLGEIVIDIVFESDKLGEFGCGDCVRYVTARSTKALFGDDRTNAQRCLPYRAQTKEMVPEEYRKKVQNVIYGYDIYQLICPYNRGKDFYFHEEMGLKIDEVYLKLKPTLSMSNENFKQQFGHLAGLWHRKKPLQRNTLIALADLGDRTALFEVSECLTDVHPIVKETAA